MSNKKEALTLEIKNAENFHGHLGPFLVIGVKMARLAKKILNVDRNKLWDLQVVAELPLITPYSCILDGIQATTQCTVGNRKLEVRSSDESVVAIFKLKSQNKTLKIHVNKQMIEMLKEQLSKGASNEDLAWKIADMPENQLFNIENGKF
ncbi:MAG: formylmethanofuran dehydrogenase subunit E family protein [Candidatus Bathyarchaeia archaeon]